MGDEMEIDKLDTILAIEQIKRLKARYFYHLDHQNWTGWKRDVFAPDATMDVPGLTTETLRGVDNIIAWVAGRASGQRSVHHGHMPDIEILSADRAKATWAMEDILFKSPEQAERLGYRYLHGFGHYHETYVRLPVGWRIESTRLTRLYVERDTKDRSADAIWGERGPPR
jgi:hypothetical protein